MILLSTFSTYCFADDLLENEELDNFIQVSTDDNNSPEPITNSRHILALDRKTLLPLYEKNAYSETPMASTTKIMTAIIAIENCDLNETVKFPKEAVNVRGSCLEVPTNAQMSLNDVLYGLMMRSRKRLCCRYCRTHFWLSRKFCRINESKSRRITSYPYSFCNPTWIRR